MLADMAGLPMANDEQAVSTLSPMLFATLRENGALARFIVGTAPFEWKTGVGSP
jgi:hypothetical protein